MAKAKKKGGPVEMLVVGSKVRGYIRGKGVMMSGELLAALNGKVGCMLDDAVARATGNKRKTVKPQDL